MVVLIVSSSRGGSSIVAEALRHHEGLAHLPGEVNPLFRPIGLAWPDSGTGSDALDERHAPEAARAAVWAAAGGFAAVDAASLARLCHARLEMQWPALDIPLDAVSRAIEGLEGASPEALTAALVARLHASFPALDPGWYDLGVPPRAPPNPTTVVEEPPFILFSGWAPRPGAPLILKSPSNAYRLPFLRRAFPDLRIVHLTRNPAAAVNGLIDGWLHPGFHAHAVGGLEIGGYSDRVAGGERWWKFDLPPGWREWTGAPLAEVAAFQWRSAHAHALGWRAQNPDVPTLHVRFEDFVRDAEATVDRVCSWIGVDATPALRDHVRRGLSPRMATARPRQRRWHARHADLAPVLARRDVQEVAAALGYSDVEEWT